MFGGISRKFMQNKPERSRQIGRQQNRLAFNPQPIRWLRGVSGELLLRQFAEIGSLPCGLNKQSMRARQRREPALEAIDQLFVRRVGAQAVARDRLDHRQDIAHAMCQLAQQKPLSYLAVA